ncbi:MAG: hypothetical protein ACM36B_08270, partial [Bacteroidota bacterium]
MVSSDGDAAPSVAAAPHRERRRAVGARDGADEETTQPLVFLHGARANVEFATRRPSNPSRIARLPP